MGEFKEKRNSQRIKVTFEVPGLGEGQDISSEGICLVVKNPFPIGKLLNLKFRPHPEASLIKCKGKIIWHRQMADGQIKVGIKFVWPSATEK